MKTYTKRLRAQADCIGMVQEIVTINTAPQETDVARRALESLASVYPNALMAEISVTITARIVVDADAAKLEK
jgi:hypothetical protein